MATPVDARGLSCPQPTILTRKALQAVSDGEVVILVDTMTQVDNCTRAAETLGWKVDCRQKDDAFELTCRK